MQVLYFGGILPLFTNTDFSLYAFFLEIWSSQKKAKRTILSELKAVHISDAVEKYTREVLHDMKILFWGGSAFDHKFPYFV